ncbi:MAG: translation initiation factor IF-2, partial [Deltaproteobacteria bacterium]|nr:translation initiation factor IF-2 [Deltaproteobacteria bacterium]
EFLQIMGGIGRPLKTHMSAIPEESVDQIKEEIGEYQRGRMVEKRVAGGVIRRRQAKAPPPPPAPEEALVAKEAEAGAAPAIAPEATPIAPAVVETPSAVEAPRTVQPGAAAATAAPAETARKPLPADDKDDGLAARRRGDKDKDEGKPKKKTLKPVVRRGREVIEVLPEELPGLAQRAPTWRGGVSVRPTGGQSYGRGRPGYRRRTVVKKDSRKTLITTPRASKRIVKISGQIGVQDFAKRMGVKAPEVLKKLIGLGMMVNITSAIEPDAAALVAQEFGFEVENVTVEFESLLVSSAEAKPEDLLPRPPVVTVMGHVDHGKTSLLDAIRQTNVTSREAGGITQHIGAYHVRTKKGNIVFLDTPGHEAFTAMRARGAQVTDIVILVVAADDGVMPQTIEAIDHAKAAGVPILVAINKIDTPGADPERIKNKLMEYELVPESLGGDTIFVNVSAKQKTGLDELLESIALQAEIMELKANPDMLASGVVIEGRVERGRGPIATILVREGTLRQGDYIVAGFHHGRVRAINDDLGKPLKEVTPGLPAEVQGLSGVPLAGDPFNAAPSEQVAREVAEKRGEKDRAGSLTAAEKPTLENFLEQIQEGEIKELRVVIKADTQGSVEAVRDALQKLSGKDVQVRMIHGAVGGINESDVNLASASAAITIGFHVRPDPKALALAQQEKVDIRLYTIIYEAVDEIRKAMEGLLAPTLKETVAGRAEVRNVFSIAKLGTIGGCMISDGTISRSNRIRVIRDSVVVYDGKIGSLRRFKDDVREVQSGLECGIRVENFNDVKVGDVLETYNIEELQTRLESSGARAAPAGARA